MEDKAKVLNRPFEKERGQMDEREKRIRALTHLYYSNQKVQEAILKFAKDREVVPRYFEGFGKRPDMIQYPSDIMGLVKKGATSFHCSEELWSDALQLSSEITPKEMGELRKGWDLLIDIDSKYLDYSKKACLLVIRELENFGIENYGVKFSGSKGFHLIVSSKAFESVIEGEDSAKNFPEWPRAICEFLMARIKRDYNLAVSEEDIKALEKITKLKEKDLTMPLCPRCGRVSERGKQVLFVCPRCKTEIQRNNPKITKRKLRCVQDACPGILEIAKEQEIFYCEYCKISNINKLEEKGKNVVYSRFAKESNEYGGEFEKVLSESVAGGLDLVLVAPRHLFRMPYSLHEKTSLASIVLNKDEIENFSPKDADPMKVEIRDFMPENEIAEGKKLLLSALEWKKQKGGEEKRFQDEKYSKIEFKEIDVGKVSDDMFPPAIKKLLKGLEEGRKRGLFVLITFLRALNFPPSELNKRVREWNEKNSPPLKEGYVRSQIEWHLKQTKKILPPNYSNDAFYKDLGILSEKPKSKNPLADVMRKLRSREN